MSIKTENYVIQNYPFAKKAGERFKMDPLVILTQGAYESAWGTSGISKNQKNFFGTTTRQHFKANKLRNMLGNLIFFVVKENPQLELFSVVSGI